MVEATSALELTENDILGAILHEMLENATVHSLRWCSFATVFESRRHGEKPS